MATVVVRADRALEAAERLLDSMRRADSSGDDIPSVAAIADACRLALKPRFSDGSGTVTLTGHEPEWLLPYFQEPPEL